jgi:hypothetical protein
MTQTQAKPAECRPVYVEQPPQTEPSACGYKLLGRNLATLRRAELLRFARDKGISIGCDTKIEIYCAIGVHLQQVAWPADRDLSKLKKEKA